MNLLSSYIVRAELSHYSHRVFWDIYPLSKEEFAENSIQRRASYDYLVQTIEIASKITTVLVSTLSLNPITDTYAKKFYQGIELKILPKSLGESLVKLSRLRNKVVHENPDVNQALTVYDQLGALVITGISMHELTRAFSSYLSDRNDPYPSITIDKNYLINYVNRNSSSSNRAQSIGKVLERIKTDRSIFICEIDSSQIKSLTSKAVEKD